MKDEAFEVARGLEVHTPPCGHVKGPQELRARMRGILGEQLVHKLSTTCGALNIETEFHSQ